METEKHTIGERLRKTLRKRLIAGILIILPAYITYFIIKTLFSFVGGYFSPIVRRIIETNNYKLPDLAVTIISLILTFIALYFIGLFAANIVGARIIHYFELLVNKMPLIKTIYSSSKQIIQTATLPGKTAFKRVVLVDFPKQGVKSLGFVTGDTKITGDEKFYGVFVPTTPSPTNGYLLFFTEKDVVETTLSVEEGMKVILSCGILSPPKLT
ncbi:MAG TPA: DUF502 domain-containing protein [Candidatus Brocadiales bacterium]|nr:DUF502 domain-containing protein [Candidatus Brocadiales bacterium]